MIESPESRQPPATALAVAAVDVSVRYPGAAQPALDHVTLEVQRGDAIGVVGESGSGKSTLGRLLVGLQEPTDGSVMVGGRPWSKVRAADLQRRLVQMIFQDPYAALNPRLSIVAAVAEALEVVQGESRAAARAQALILLESVGIDRGVAERAPRALSGGQRQRAVIARALACDPHILVADEPTSSLDVSAQAQVLNLLNRLRHERGLGVAMITHNLAVLPHVAESVVVLRRGKVVERGDTRQLLSDPQHPYTRQLVEHSLRAAGRRRSARLPQR